MRLGATPPFQVLVIVHFSYEDSDRERDFAIYYGIVPFNAISCIKLRNAYQIGFISLIKTRKFVKLGFINELNAVLSCS